MRVWALRLWWIVVLGAAWPITALSDPAGIGDPYFPLMGNSGYDVLHYNIDLDVALAQQMVRAVVTIDLQALATLEQFHLDFSGPKIDALEVNGTPAAFERRASELIVMPVQPIRNAETAQVRVRYTGRFQADQRSSFGGGWQHYPTGVFVASQPDGSATWFPSNDHPLDKATFTFTIRVPAGNLAAANGVLIDTRHEPNATTYVWHMAQPMATYLATVNITDFVVVDGQSPSGVPIRNYFPTELAPRLEELFAVQAAMLDFYESLIGPYPFDVYGAVVARASFPFALETQTLSLFPRDIARLPLPTVNDIIAHEMVHQWFGNSVSVQHWRDIWLNEGFATYFAALWVEHTDGPAAFQRLMENYYAMISQPGDQQREVRIGDPGAEQLFHGLVYIRGAWTLHALRQLLGDEVFFRAIREYYQRYAYGNASIADFIASVQATSGRDLGAFFQQWLYETRTPTVRFSS